MILVVVSDWPAQSTVYAVATIKGIRFFFDSADTGHCEALLSALRKLCKRAYAHVRGGSELQGREVISTALAQLSREYHHVILIVPGMVAAEGWSRLLIHGRWVVSEPMWSKRPSSNICRT